MYQVLFSSLNVVSGCSELTHAARRGQGEGDHSHSLISLMSLFLSGAISESARHPSVIGRNARPRRLRLLSARLVSTGGCASSLLLRHLLPHRLNKALVDGLLSTTLFVVLWCVCKLIEVGNYTVLWRRLAGLLSCITSLILRFLVPSERSFGLM